MTVFANASNGSKKPVVYYTQQLGPVVAGNRASVYAAKHYRLGRLGAFDWISTSPVVMVHEDGTTFETLNSMYVLREEPEGDEPALTEDESVV
jgi:hypothetical protein